ncbi:hypothetical protein [Thioclava pacifica]|uniref:Uncharacterized protein n=1 Tax=Thioclava pacifica DSM 10166 TaxID=1353537 RepID=A0A074JAI0_9RHOB|nr:hypothetical protein [Thioclava pacifica]KEO52855.1 hypothetical protein TP2_07910 [Thioclava pacifica DSM 10166]
MTRKLFTTAIAALALTAGSAGIASAAGFSHSTNDSGQGVIAVPMSTSSPASGPMASGATNQGKTQIAAELQTFPGLSDVDPRAYTVAELTNMLHAARKGDLSKVNFYRGHEDRLPGGPGVGATNQGKAQLAAELGLNPKAYTTAQLEEIAQAVRHDDFETAKLIAAQGNSASGGRLVFVPVVVK